MNSQSLSSIAPSMDFSGRTIVVTGGTSGIGRSIAEGFVAGNASVIICSRNADDCERVAGEITQQGPGTCIGIRADLASTEGLLQFADAIGTHTESLHTLVNNAGTTLAMPIEDYPIDGWEHIMDLNLKAPFFLVQQLLPLLRRAALSDWPASVINIGSITGLSVQPRPNYGYAASKAGLHHLTKVMARNLAREGIMVNAIAPGLFITGLSVGHEAVVERFISETPAGRAGQPRDIADLACFMASPSGSFLCGAIVPLDGGAGI